MFIKFLPHGKGDPALAARYLVDDKDHQNRKRAGVEILKGDPITFTAIAQSSAHKFCYTSVVIAWAKEDQPDEDDIDEVLNEFEKHAFAGLKPHQYHMTAVMHVEDNGAKHVHILVPRIELTSGKSLNIAPPGHHHYFDPLRDYFNYKNYWTRPDDPLRSKDSKLPNHIYLQNASAIRAGLKGGSKEHRIELIDNFVHQRIMEGVITNRSSLIQTLSEIGTITRQGKNYISLKTDAGTDRLKADFYHENFSVGAYLQDRDRAASSQRTYREISEDLERDRAKADQCHGQLAVVRAKRERYNKQYYPDVSRTEGADGGVIQGLYEGAENRLSATEGDQIFRSSNFRGDNNQYENERGKNDRTTGESASDGTDYQTAKVDQTDGSQPFEAEQGLERESRSYPEWQYSLSQANSVIKDANRDDADSNNSKFNNYHGEINYVKERIGTSQTGQDQSITIRSQLFTASVEATNDYTRKLRVDSRYAEELSAKTSRENIAIRNRIEEQNASDRQLRTGVEKGIANTRSNNFFTRLKTRIITTLKSLFGSSRDKPINQTTGRDQSEATSTESQSFGLSRLASFAKQRSARHRVISSNIEGFGQYESNIKRIDENLQNTCRLIKRYKFPEHSLDYYLRLIYENNERIHLSESIEMASQADRDMRKLIKDIQRDPYGAYAKRGLNIDYSRAIKKCVKDMVDQIQYIRPEDYQNIDGFINTVKCYTEMLALSHPDIERTPNYYHVSEMIQTSINKLEDRIQQINEEPDLSTTEPIRLNSMHQTLDRRQQSDKSNDLDLEM